MGIRSGTQAGWLRLPQGALPQYGDVIRDAATRHGLSEKLVAAVIRAESGFNPSAISVKGAQGLMQLMPETASMLGVRNAFDPRQNIEGGVRHLRMLVDRYQNNLPLALAAYNAGERAVDRYGGIPPYPETRDYVEKILRLIDGGNGRGPSPTVIYRRVEDDGTITFTNIPPRGRR
jgi:soluble lytic murein transglycosylase-like protein